MGIFCWQIPNSSLSCTAEKGKEGVRLKIKMADSREKRAREKSWGPKMA